MLVTTKRAPPISAADNLSSNSSGLADFDTRQKQGQCPPLPRLGEGRGEALHHDRAWFRVPLPAATARGPPRGEVKLETITHVQQGGLTPNAVKDFGSRNRENLVVSGIARSLTTSATTYTHAFSRVKKCLTALGEG